MSILDKLETKIITFLPSVVASSLQSNKYKNLVRVIIDVRECEPNKYEGLLLLFEPNKQLTRRYWYGVNRDRVAAVLLYNFLQSRILTTTNRVVLSFMDQKYNKWLLKGNEEEEEPYTFRACREKLLTGITVETNHFKLAKDIKELC